jgi:predicted N-formylglutamate amidohydrolase
MTAALLAPDDPPPFEVTPGGAASPYLVLCDHAGRQIPRVLGSLGLPAHELDRHIAWDIGAAGLSRQLAGALDAWLILQNYSRLVIDCNRPRESPESIVLRSEDTDIPGNQHLLPHHAAQRAEQIFEPYHARIRQELDRREALGQRSLLIFVHSFTPVFRGVTRPWHAGVLSLDDTRLARPLLSALRLEPGLTIGDNEPYAASTLTDYSLVQHARRRGLPHVELEVRQDLIADDSGQSQWATLLARLLDESSAFRD